MPELQRGLHATAEVRPQKWPPRLLRCEVPDYLLEQHGIRLTIGWLNKAAVRGDGPAYTKPFRSPLYALSDLDTWALERLGTPRRSTSETAP